MSEQAAMQYLPDRDPEPLTPIEELLNRHRAPLMGTDGVVGVGLGRTPLGDDAIIVFLRDAAAQGRIPTSLEGIPVQTEITGEIDALEA